MPKPQRIVVIHNSLQPTRKVGLTHPTRHNQKHRLVKSIERYTTLQKPPHDRRRTQQTRRILNRPQTPAQPMTAQPPQGPQPSDAQTPHAASATNQPAEPG